MRRNPHSSNRQTRRPSTFARRFVGTCPRARRTASWWTHRSTLVATWAASLFAASTRGSCSRFDSLQTTGQRTGRIARRRQRACHPPRRRASSTSVDSPSWRCAPASRDTAARPSSMRRGSCSPSGSRLTRWWTVSRLDGCTTQWRALPRTLNVCRQGRRCQPSRRRGARNSRRPRPCPREDQLQTAQLQAAQLQAAQLQAAQLQAAQPPCRMLRVRLCTALA